MAPSAPQALVRVEKGKQRGPQTKCSKNGHLAQGMVTHTLRNPIMNKLIKEE